MPRVRRLKGEVAASLSFLNFRKFDVAKKV